MKTLITPIFLLSLVALSSAAADSGDWSPDRMKPLYASCSGEVKVHNRVLDPYERRADVEIKKLGAKGFADQLAASTPFSDFVLLWAAYLIPEEIRMRFTLSECWVNYQSIVRLLEEKKYPEAKKQYSQWLTCNQENFRGAPPRGFKEMESCLKQLVTPPVKLKKKK